MDYFDEAINKTKEVFGVVKQKTEEAISIGVQKYDIAVLEKDLSRLYLDLGKAAFAQFSGESDIPAALAEGIAAIKAKNAQIEKAREDLSKSKGKRICPKCAASIDENSTFCSFCGEKVTFTE